MTKKDNEPNALALWCGVDDPFDSKDCRWSAESPCCGSAVGSLLVSHVWGGPGHSGVETLEVLSASLRRHEAGQSARRMRARVAEG